MIWAIIILSFSSFGNDQCSIVPKELRQIQELNEKLGLHGANTAEIESAPCKTKLPPSMETINQLISATRKSSSNGIVNGVNFKDEDPELIKQFKELTTKNDLLGGAIDEKNQTDMQKKYLINPECTKVDCAVKKIWGEELGKKILYIKLKHGYNASELAFERSDRFSADEINDVMMALDDLPSRLTPLAVSNQRLTHYTRGESLNKKNKESKTAANAVIMIFDQWNELSHRQKQLTIFHELSHGIGTKLKSMDENPNWFELSGWIKKEDQWIYDDSNCFASEYAKENPAEDWAETIATYRYNGLNLKNSCPSKYNYIKDNVFNGAEYTDLNSCSELPKEKLQAASKMFMYELQNGITLKKYSEDEVLQKCAHQFTRYPPIPSEMASCSLSMRFNEESSSIDALVKKTLLASQIQVTEKNINDLLSSIKVNQELEKKLLENTKGISEAIEKSLSSSIQNSLSIDMGKVTKDDPYWWAGDFKCDQKLMEMNKKELSNCLAKVMLDEDSIKQDYHAGKFPTYKVGTLFSDEAIESIKKLREQKFVQHLVEQPEFEEGLEKNISRFKVSLSLHQYLVSDTVSTLGKNLSPKEFCEKSYGVATDTFGFGIDAGTSFPKIQKWCEKIEATQPTRFKINPKDWDLMIETMLPK